MEQPNYYSILTADIRYDKRLKRHADCKVLYSEITALANQRGYCHAKNSYFAELYDRPKETISKWINLLRDCGYLKIKMIYKDGTKQIIERRIYPVSTPINADKGIDTDVKTYSRKRGEGIDADVKTPINVNVKDNNTSINATRKNNTSINTHTHTTNHSHSSMPESNQSPVDLSDKQKLSQYWQRELKTVTNGVIESKLSNWVDEFGFEFVKYYLDYALLNQIDRSRIVNYLDSIFNRCRERGIKTLQDAKKAEQEHKDKAKQKFSKKDKAEHVNKPRYKFKTHSLPEGMTQSEAIAKELAEVEVEEGAS